MLSLYWRWMALVARNTWMRRRGASASARRGELDVLAVAAGEAADDRPVHLAGDRLHALPVPLGGGGKARLDDIDAQLRQRACHAQLLRRVMLQPGDCSPSRSVVSKISTRSGCGSHGMLSGDVARLASGALVVEPGHAGAQCLADLLDLVVDVAASSSCW